MMGPFIRLVVCSAFCASVVGSAAPANGQQTPVMLVHGFKSDGGTWDDMVTNLNLPGSQFVPYRTDLSWQQPVSFQAYELNSYMYWSNLGANTVLVGHSMGGLTSRATSRMRAVDGIITIGTPHNGTGIATSAGELAAKISGAWIDQLAVYGALNNFLSYGDFFDPMYLPASFAMADFNISNAAWAVASTAAYGLGYSFNPSSLDDLRFGSTWRANLNATEPSYPLAHKTGIACHLDAGYWGGPLALVLSGTDADNLGFNLQVYASFAGIDALGLLLNWDSSSTLDFWNAAIAAGALEDYAYRFGTFASWWTNTVVGGYPHDGAVPWSSQFYPGESFAPLCLSPHTSETSLGVSQIRGTLNFWHP